LARALIRPGLYVPSYYRAVEHIAEKLIKIREKQEVYA